MLVKVKEKLKNIQVQPIVKASRRPEEQGLEVQTMFKSEVVLEGNANNEDESYV